MCSFYTYISVIQGDVWLCMEVMDASLDKFYRVLTNEDRRIPENVFRKIAVDVCCRLVCTVSFTVRLCLKLSQTLGILNSVVHCMQTFCV